MATADFNKAQVEMVGNTMVAIGDAPNCIANKFCIGGGFLQEVQSVHPCKIAVSYSFADSFGERFGACVLDNAPAPKVKTCLQKILEPMAKARSQMDFCDHFEVHIGDGNHRKVNPDYEIMDLVKKAVKEFTFTEKETTLEIRNYWPTIRPGQFYLALVTVTVTKSTDSEYAKRDTPIISVT